MYQEKRTEFGGRGAKEGMLEGQSVSGELGIALSGQVVFQRAAQRGAVLKVGAGGADHGSPQSLLQEGLSIQLLTPLPVPRNNVTKDFLSLTSCTCPEISQQD